MRYVHGGRQDFVARNNPRGGVFHYKRLVEGVSGSPGNFGLMLSRTYDDFFSPRHRHNFEQVRFQIEGVCGFGRDGEMGPGTMGYFPEGVYYGPQSADAAALVLVLQFGGPSGAGYMSEDDLQTSVAQLSAVGNFQDGVFHRTAGEGRRNQDAYEAAWENFNQRRLEYPPARYQAPTIVADAAVDWEPIGPGVGRKLFGRFEGGTELSRLRLEAGARHDIAGEAVLFVLSGDGGIGAEPVAAESSLYLADAEVGVLCAGAELDVLMIRLPTILASGEALTHAA
jgi:hypothetical protein